MKLHKLTSHGVSHVILPLLLVVGLAVGGTYVMVSNHADPANFSATAKKKAAAPPKPAKPAKPAKVKTTTSRFTVFSKGDTYKSVHFGIAATDTKFTYAKCGSQKITTAKAAGYDFKQNAKTKKWAALSAVCVDPPTGSVLIVSFSSGKKGATDTGAASAIAITGKNSQCIYVHDTGISARAVQTFNPKAAKGQQCTPPSTPAATARAGSSTTATPPTNPGTPTPVPAGPTQEQCDAAAENDQVLDGC